MFAVALWGGLGAAALLILLGSGWIFSLPPAPIATPSLPVASVETDGTIAALRRSKRPRPLIAIVGINDATEITDYLMPYGVLRRADVADVMALATQTDR